MCCLKCRSCVGLLLSSEPLNFGCDRSSLSLSQPLLLCLLNSQPLSVRQLSSQPLRLLHLLLELLGLVLCTLLRCRGNASCLSLSLSTQSPRFMLGCLLSCNSSSLRLIGNASSFSLSRSNAVLLSLSLLHSKLPRVSLLVQLLCFLSRNTSSFCLSSDALPF